ncbi:MAG: zinc ribbon domain-containing protein, partial [Candidatus Heimdallarchaeota archaeon]|nr:zinc ribbon domain-containing protein [Candidatus Heimdallarchaeota archaeon]
MTIFCPSCGTANRDEAEMCSECGNVIPRLNDSVSQQPVPTSPSPNDVRVTESSESEFGIDVGYPPPPPPPGESDSSGYPPYDHRNAQSLGRKTVCERCGT